MQWLTGGHVYDVHSGSFRRADVEIDGDRIGLIVDGGAELGRDDDVIDVDGAWLLPGLIDCHVHITQPTDVGDPAKAAARSDAAGPFSRLPLLNGP
jgi:imidazolonepropionase-like amidohydrolase